MRPILSSLRIAGVPATIFWLILHFPPGKFAQSDRLSDLDASDTPPDHEPLIYTFEHKRRRLLVAGLPLSGRFSPRLALSPARLTLYRRGGSISPTFNRTISAVGVTDFAQSRGPLRLTESRPASYRWKQLSASTISSPQFTSQNSARQLASAIGPASRLPRLAGKTGPSAFPCTHRGRQQPGRPSRREFARSEPRIFQRFEAGAFSSNNDWVRTIAHSSGKV